MGKSHFFILNLIASSLLGILLASCFNPFFPESGGALHEPLDTPEKTISALQNAYETSSLLQFQSLLWSFEDFNTYIEYDELNYTASLTHLPQYQVSIDTIVQSVYIPEGQKYLELSWAQEESVHSQLLNSKNELYFSGPLTIASTDYILDSTGAQVSYVVVKVVDTELNVIVGGDTLAPFAITGQHFALKQDPQGEWKIWKWIELN